MRQNAGQIKRGQLQLVCYAECITCQGRAAQCTMYSQPLKHEASMQPLCQSADKRNTIPTSHWVLLCSTGCRRELHRVKGICSVLLLSVRGWGGFRQTAQHTMSKLCGFSFVSAFCCVLSVSTETKLKQWLSDSWVHLKG